MTPSRAAQEKPTSPRTEAQTMREVLVRLIDANAGLTLNGIEEAWDAMDAIEREAAAATPSLDVLRRLVAVVNAGSILWMDPVPADSIAAIHDAKELLARLDEGSATPDPEELDPRWCHDKECFLLEKGVWGHPVSAHDKWATPDQPGDTRA